MAFEEQHVNNSVFADLKAKFDGLDQKQKVVVMAVGAFFVFIIVTRLFASPVKQEEVSVVAQAPADVEVRSVNLDTKKTYEDVINEEDVFGSDTADNDALRNNFYNKAAGEMEAFKEEMRSRDLERERLENQRSKKEAERDAENKEMMRTMNETMRSMQQMWARQQEDLARMTEDFKEQRALSQQAAGSVNQQKDFLSQAPIRERRKGITQQPLSLNMGGGAEGTPLVQGLTGGVLGGPTGGVEQGKSFDETQGGAEGVNRRPFIPPLGFIKGTMLNGVDALTAGTTTPALVRLEGVYKTAMNSTVVLNGCFMLVEFQGEISTERAKGKPARMTCVYPDQGAVTYSVSGYVVDSEDGLEGIPGLFFEGHAGRLALAIAAEFATGITDIISSNQSTTTVNENGTAVTTLTGSQAKASLYGSASDALNSLQEYLADRASRVVPFIRIDALREIHIVLLSGTQLRKQGDAWSQLFKAE